MGFLPRREKVLKLCGKDTECYLCCAGFIPPPRQTVRHTSWQKLISFFLGKFNIFFAASFQDCKKGFILNEFCFRQTLHSIHHKANAAVSPFSFIKGNVWCV